METLRDVVIIIAGLLFIILTLGMLVGGFILYRRVRRLIRRVQFWFKRVSSVIHVIRILREVFRPSRKAAKA